MIPDRSALPTDDQCEIILRTFVDAADEDYVMARWAALTRLEQSFMWHSQQAAEKYLKAFALVKGYKITGKEFSHNLETPLAILRAECPSALAGNVTTTLHLFGQDPNTSVHSTQEAMLACIGIADTRYNVTNRYVDGRAIKLLDHWVFALRRALASHTRLHTLRERMTDNNWIGTDFCLFPGNWFLGEKMFLESKLRVAISNCENNRPLTSFQNVLLTENAEIWTGEPLMERHNDLVTLGSPLLARCTVNMRMEILDDTYTHDDQDAYKVDKENYDWAVQNIPMGSKLKEQFRKAFDKIAKEHRSIKAQKGP